MQLAEARHVEVLDRAAGQHVDLAGFVGNRARRGVRNDLPVDLVEIGLALDAIVRVLDELDEGALLPLLELEGAGADRRVVGGIGLEVGAFIDVLRDHRHRADLEDADEWAERLLQREDDGVVVERLDLFDLHSCRAHARGSASSISIENSTSAAVNGLPSCQVTPCLSLKV